VVGNTRFDRRLLGQAEPLRDLRWSLVGFHPALQRLQLPKKAGLLASQKQRYPTTSTTFWCRQWRPTPRTSHSGLRRAIRVRGRERHQPPAHLPYGPSGAATATQPRMACRRFVSASPESPGQVAPSHPLTIRCRHSAPACAVWQPNSCKHPPSAIPSLSHRHPHRCRFMQIVHSFFTERPQSLHPAHGTPAQHMSPSPSPTAIATTCPLRRAPHS